MGSRGALEFFFSVIEKRTSVFNRKLVLLFWGLFFILGLNLGLHMGGLSKPQRFMYQQDPVEDVC